VGHSQLNKSINVIGKYDYCQETESVEHVLLQCGQYQRERERLRSSVREKGIQEISLKCILSITSLDIVSNILLSFFKTVDKPPINPTEKEESL
jgi:hypothetical protein